MKAEKGTQMLKEYQTVFEGGEGELIEKKSRFIGQVVPIKTEEDAILQIETITKQHWKANHHCFAYVLGEGFEIQRCSDDGEPSGTAGKPMLDVLMGRGLHDTLVVVTRYFGGTLLGTGGLVRAYTGAVKEGLDQSNIITKILGRKLCFTTDYNGLGKIQFILGQRGLAILESRYTQKVEVEVMIPIELVDSVCAEAVEKTNGTIEINTIKDCYFAKINQDLLLF